MTAAARYIHPSNAVTYLSILAGLLAIVAARDARSWSLTGTLIAVSAAADTLDGRFARLFPRNERPRRFGIELDCLADALTFGVVPVVALYLLLEFQSTGARVAALSAAAATRRAAPADGRDGGPSQGRSARSRAMTSWAALWPGAPITQPPGQAPEPQR
jgi:phosphatidylserine synthase